jgi:hypothetical protein
MNLRYGVVGAALVAACARGVTDDGAAYVSSGTPDAEAQSADEAGPTTGEPPGAGDDASSSSPDASAATDSASEDTAADVKPGQDAAPDAPPAVGCSVVINEVMTGVTGAATDEFVEIYNPCATPVDVSGFSLVYRAGTSTAPNDAAHDADTLLKWASGTAIPAHAWRVYAGADYGGAKDGALGSGLKDGSGAIAIRDASGTIVDAIGYGAGTINPANAFIEGAPAAANAVVGAPGQSLARHPDGADSNDNATDFRAGAPTPGAAN